MAAPQREERNQEATVYVGDLDERVNDALLWELMLQAGPVVNVHIPKDKLTQAHQGYGFVEFNNPSNAEYAIKIMNMIPLFGKPIKVNKAQQPNKTGSLDIGANLFVGNLDPDVDEKMLYDTFSVFGIITGTPKIMRDPETGESRGFGFLSYDCFESSDAAIEAMDGQYLCNRAISVTYAMKKGSKERHGSDAERLLAAKNSSHRPTQYPNYGGMVPGLMPPMMGGMMPPPNMMAMGGMMPPPMPGMMPPPNMMGMGGMMPPPMPGMMPPPMAGNWHPPAQ